MIKTKIKIGIFSLIFLATQLGSPFLFASSNTNATQQCGANAPICLQTPISLTTYLEFQQKALALMTSDPFQTTTEQIEIGEGGLFTNKLLKLQSPEQSTNLPILTDIARELETSFTNMIAGSTTSSALFILSTLSTLSDNLMGFTILFQERPIVRDRSKLLDIDRKISEATYVLGQKAKITKKIKNAALFNKIVSEYQTLGLLEKGFSLAEQISYFEVLYNLQALNTQMKIFLSSNNTYELEKPNSTIRLSQDWIFQLKEEYRCARFTLGFKCNPPGYAFLANLRTLSGNTKRTSKSALNTIQQALNRLSQSLKGFKAFRSSKNQSLTSEELELLREVYGLDTTRLTKERLSSLSPFYISQSTKSLFRNAKSDILELPSYLKENSEIKKKPLNKNLEEQTKKKITKEKREAEKKANKKKQKEERKERKKQQEKWSLEAGNLKAKYTNPKLSEMLHKSFQEVLTANEQIKHEIELGNTILISNQFAHLSFQIQKIATIIGNKQSGTRQLLDEICRYQCSNKPNSTCYIQ